MQIQARFGDAVQVLQSPLQRIEWVDFDRVSDFDALIFTSQNGVLSWTRAENVPRGVAYCVGPRTAELARDYGFDAVDAGGDAEDLIAHILKAAPNGPLLHIRGEHGQGDIANRLNSAGIETHQLVTYRQVAMDLTDQAVSALMGDCPVIAPLFSPRSATLFAQALPKGAAPWVAVISPNAADRLDVVLQRRMMVSKQPNADGMLDVIGDILGQVGTT